MRVVADAACWANRRGFGRFTRELLKAMAEESRGHELTLLIDSASANRASLPSNVNVATVATAESPAAAASALGSRSLLDLWRFSRAAARLLPDAIFFPAVYSFFPVTGSTPAVVTFHDAIAEERPADIFPTRRSRLFWNLKVRMALRQASRVATVSEYARGRIAAAFGLPPDEIAVLGEGVGKEFRPVHDEQALQRWGLSSDSPYLLYVGGVSPHKNLDGLVRALARLREGGRSERLVICGDYQGDPFHSSYRELRGLIGRLGLDEWVRFTGFVPDADLAVLYSAASAVVLPSFDEGFCLPAAEAMACGAPVAAARRGALPETLGTAAVFFDPADPTSIAATLGELLSSGEARQNLRNAGVERARLFRWPDVAAHTWQTLEDLPQP